eukprot:CAMPEP_0206137052 /NCGR_PEP_ID=MMETSP1473-20131121/2235_1 /ASSEMBLY_ACC=CAM_ASM_001109 /TAXON_ID=1461547 /ORGANISM="Stichococcus sp, Strain RCC1054" /LENGTH=134 /DNA_ID=CAMNT_0053529947 /DNA_START=758 /DNA_END=1163 /DNA_ORIENTATION=-
MAIGNKAEAHKKESAESNANTDMKEASATCKAGREIWRVEACPQWRKCHEWLDFGLHTASNPAVAPEAAAHALAARRQPDEHRLGGQGGIPRGGGAHVEHLDLRDSRQRYCQLSICQLSKACQVQRPQAGQSRK